MHKILAEGNSEHICLHHWLTSSEFGESDLGCRHISSGQMANVGSQQQSRFFVVLGLDLDVQPGRPPHIRGRGQQHKSSTQPQRPAKMAVKLQPIIICLCRLQGVLSIYNVAS